MPRNRQNVAETVRLDNVKVSNRIKHEGKYTFECIDCERQRGDGAPYFAQQWEAIESITGDDDSVGGIVFHNISMHKNALWHLKMVLEAGGFDIPEGEFELQPSDFLGLQINAVVVSEKYEGLDGANKTRYVFDVDSIEPAKSSGTKGGKRKKADDDDDEGDARSTGRKKRGKAAQEAADGEDGATRGRGRKRGSGGRTAAKTEAVGPKTDDDEDDDNGRSSRRSSRSNRAKKREPETYTEDDILALTEKELEGVVETEDLDLDLSQYKSLRRMRSAVIDALDENDQIADE